MSTDSDAAMLQRRNHELEILNAIAQALNRETDLDRALRVTLAHVADLCNMQTGWIWLIDEESGDPYLAVAQQLPPALAENPHRMSGETYCYCLDTYQKGDMRGAANVKIVTCTRLEGLVDDADGLRYHASIPLYAHGKKLGILNVVSRDWQELSKDDLRLLYTVGDLLSMAIERVRLFERSAQAGAAEERSRLARELHDTLAQGLTALALQLETADALLESDPERARHMIQQALGQVRANLDETRRSVQDLRSRSLEHGTFADALRKLAQDYAARWKLALDLELQPGIALPARVESALYRVAQEALTNIVRHARAEKIRLTLTADAGEVRLRIHDDGRGFDPAQVCPGRFGLIGMNERVKLLDGHLTITSAPDSGVCIEAVIPLGDDRARHEAQG
ncbi:MAG: GAF domain-containing sensor histidine kinase [Anaerolineae bacterium]|nr:GAF domain-containing sensor histidine kinase [Anaerolineae bacterium]